MSLCNGLVNKTEIIFTVLGPVQLSRPKSAGKLHKEHLEKDLKKPLWKKQKMKKVLDFDASAN